MNDWQDAEEHVERAHQHYEARRWDDAVAELKLALALNPYRAEWHFNLGLTLEAAGRLRDAVKAFSRAVELEPDNQQSLLALGVNHLRLDEPDQAVAILKQAHQIDAARPEPLVHLIEAYTRTGDHEQAELAFYMAIHLEEVDEALAHLNMGISLLEREQAERAAAVLREAARIEPSLPQVHARLAESCAMLGRKDRARQLYLRELRNNPGDVDTMLDLGCLLMEMNRLSEAGEKFRRVLELEPDQPDAHYYLGELALIRRRESEALTQFKLAIRLEIDHPQARRRIAEILLDRGESEDARRHLRFELRRWRRRADDFTEDDLAELGSLLLDAGMAEEAVEALEAVVQRDPEDALAMHHLALALFELNRREEGVRRCAAAIALDPQRISAIYNMALAMAHDERWLRAIAWINRGLLVDPDDSALRRLRVQVRFHLVARAVRA
ncbi:MAG: tetratricopeptide repeat protein, partial [Planctomycetota bacterium]|nr:tetratricopeptide repeat protein [Planctomycetota bacterium]